MVDGGGGGGGGGNSVGGGGRWVGLLALHVEAVAAGAGVLKAGHPGSHPLSPPAIISS